MVNNKTKGFDDLYKGWSSYMLEGLPKPVVLKISDLEDVSIMGIERRVFGEDSVYVLGKVSEKEWVMKVNNLEHLKRIERNIEKKYKGVVEEVRKFEPNITEDREHEHYKIGMVNYYVEEVNEKMVKEIMQELEDNRIDYEDKDLGVYRYIVISKEDLEKVSFLKNRPIGSIKPVYMVELMWN